MSLLAHADDVLRGREWTSRATQPWPALGRLSAFVVICGLTYGAAMGLFGGLGGDRAWQVFYSAVKVPILLVATFALSLPSFFVLNTLLGVRADFVQALRALAAAQAGLTIILVSLAPITLFWYASSADYPTAILFNALMFAIASTGAQILLRREYRPLIARNPRHRWLLRIWLLLYAFVGIQMGWILRPFLGAPDKPVQFFRGGTWENAYVIVVRMIWHLFVP
ncbi:MAG TPA: hypothetical protein VGZ22_31895 [Isosphaeraceae bacterium]|jgi:hypothetical protein|nr:hypothetical protein [Isosphaeraceae bacterium]